MADAIPVAVDAADSMLLSPETVVDDAKGDPADVAEPVAAALVVEAELASALGMPDGAVGASGISAAVAVIAPLAAITARVTPRTLRGFQESWRAIFRASEPNRCMCGLTFQVGARKNAGRILRIAEMSFGVTAVG